MFTVAVTDSHPIRTSGRTSARVSHLSLPLSSLGHIHRRPVPRRTDDAMGSGGGAAPPARRRGPPPAWKLLLLCSVVTSVVGSERESGRPDSSDFQTKIVEGRERRETSLSLRRYYCSTNPSAAERERKEKQPSRKSDSAKSDSAEGGEALPRSRFGGIFVVVGVAAAGLPQAPPSSHRR